MVFAAFSTVIAVFENILSFWLELTNLSRKKAALVNILLLLVLSLPCIFSLNVWSDIALFGKNLMDLEDFTVSNLLLPIGSLGYVLFCTNRYGWGWKNFRQEVNAGKGMKLPGWMKGYMRFVLPVIILAVLVLSLI